MMLKEIAGLILVCIPIFAFLVCLGIFAAWWVLPAVLLGLLMIVCGLYLMGY